MKTLRKIIKIDDELCDGCGLCLPSCAEGALKIINGKAKIVSDKYCDGLGACIGNCPNHALTIIEREAEEFDEEAVEEYLSEQERKTEGTLTLTCGCPSAEVRTFKPDNSDCKINAGDNGSYTTNWPIKIKLIPSDAEFLKNADLLIMADCCPAVLNNRDLLKNKILMIGCPKFDDSAAYIQKFKEIFEKAGIKSITLVIMEVPCCGGFDFILKKGSEKANKNIPIKRIIIKL